MVNFLKAKIFQSPIGEILLVADSKGLHILSFLSRNKLESQIHELEKRSHETISLGGNIITDLIEAELNTYFTKGLIEFNTPIHVFGTPFQKKVWEDLLKIPFGETRSYFDQAVLSGNPKAVRAVAGANGRNRLAIIIPCHRVIHKNGDLGGYQEGTNKKRWLLDHEKLKRH
jgi:AraC family transcriptional regulator of adaptative response/methylated-DNA-[protein]-cysteine methyltransferase